MATITKYPGSDGTYYWIIFDQASLGADDEIEVVFNNAYASVILTQTYLAIADAAGVVGYKPEIGTASGFTVSGSDGRTASPTTDAPSRSQVPVALFASAGRVYIRPKPNGTASSTHIVAVWRVGHHV